MNALRGKLGWGSIEYDGTTVPFLYFGARTIFNGPELNYENPRLQGGKKRKIPAWLDFVSDRKNWAGTLVDQYGHERAQLSRHYMAFKDWLDKQGLSALDRWLQRASQNDRFVLDHNGQGYHVRAGCRNSGGYCYVAAWMDTPKKP